MTAFAVCLGAMPFKGDAGEDLPGRIKIAKWGSNFLRGSKKEFVVNEQTVRDLPGTQAALGYDAVPGDYEHQSVPGSPTFIPDPREYWARDGKVEVVAGQGIFYSPGEYTPSGKKHAAGYQDVSGFFRLDPKTKAVIAVGSVALCEHGQVEGAEFKDAPMSIAAAMSQGGDDTAMEQLCTYLRDFLDLGDDATIDDLTTSVESLVRAKNSQSTQTKPANTMLDQEVKDAFDAQNKLIASLTANVTTLVSSVATLSASQLTAQHNQAVEAQFTVAASMGKVVPESLKKKDDAGKYVVNADLVKEVLAAIPQTVEVQFSTPGNVVTASAKAGEDAAEAVVCASLQIKPEDFKKPCPIAKGNGALQVVKKTAA